MCIGNTAAQVGLFCYSVQISTYIIWYSLQVEKFHRNLDIVISQLANLKFCSLNGFQKPPNDSPSSSMYIFILIW